MSFQLHCEEALGHELLWSETSATGRGNLYIAIAVLTSLAAALSARGSIVFPLDDAYITIHNAQVLLSGSDPNYNVPALIGTTSPVHLVLIAAAMTLMPPLYASITVAYLAALLYFAALARIAFQIGASYFMSATVVLLGMTVGFTAYHLANGLETGLAMAATAWALSGAIAPRPSLWLPVLCGVLPFIRPELGVLSAALMLHQGWRRWAFGGRLSIPVDFALFAVCALPWLLWRWADTGSIFLNTADAKRYFFAEEGLPWDTKLRFVFHSLVGGRIWPLFILLLLARRSAISAIAATFAIAIIAATYVLIPHALEHNLYRYQCVLVPPLLASALIVAKKIPLVSVLMGALLVESIALAPIEWAAFRSGQQYNNDQSEVSEWLNRHLPQDSRFLVHDAGYVAFATQFQLVDLVGLKTPGSVRYHMVCTWPTNGAGRGLAISAIAQRYATHYAILLRDQTGFWDGMENGLRNAGWKLTLLRRPPGRYGYFVYAISDAPGVTRSCQTPNLLTSKPKGSVGTTLPVSAYNTALQHL